jgi:hypothetical protein
MFFKFQTQLKHILKKFLLQENEHKKMSNDLNTYSLHTRKGLVATSKTLVTEENDIQGIKDRKKNCIQYLRL